MNKLMEGLKSWYAKFKEQKKGTKITIIAMGVAVVMALVFSVFYMTRTEYEVLFKGMSNKDSGAILTKLEEQGVVKKVEGDTIFVEKGKAAALRMSLLSEVKLEDNTSPLEIITGNSSMISTDFENEVRYKLALQEELRKTIKSFDSVEDASVMLVIPKKSGFAREAEPSQAAIKIKLKDSAKSLDKENVQSITSFISRAVPNLPEENIAVVVDDMILLTEEDDSEDGDVYSNAEQEAIRRKKEKEYEDKIFNILSSTFGREGVKVAVNLDMNFDVTKRETTDYKEGYLVSEKNTVNTSTKSNTPSSSPVDDNMSNVQSNGNGGTSTTSQDQVKNYNVPEIKEVYVAAPGKIEKVSVTVLVDKNKGIMDANTKKTINNMVGTAVGYDPARGDAITIGSLNFVDSTKDLLDDVEKTNAAELARLERERLVKRLGLAIGALFIVIIVLSILRRMKKRKTEAEYDEIEELMAKDVEIDENGEVVTKVKEFAPIDFEVENEQAHITKEVKRYAQEKPEQVVEIIKSWLAEDERG